MLDCIDLADLQAHRRVELQCTSAGCRLRIAEHDTNLFTDLIDKDGNRTRFADDTRELTHRLAHETSLQAYMRITHIAFDFRLWHKCRYRIDNDNINCTTAHQSLDDIERLLARIRLRNQQVIDIHTKLFRIDRIKRMLSINKSGNTALLLSLCNHMQRDRRLTRGFRSINLNDTPTRNTANAQRCIQRQDSGRDDLDVHMRRCFPQTHDGALAKILLNLFQCVVQCFFFVHIVFTAPFQSLFII